MRYSRETNKKKCLKINILFLFKKFKNKNGANFKIR